MATVPGKPNSNVTPMLPPWARPTPADFLQAAAIMHEKQEQQALLMSPQRHLQIYTKGKLYGEVIDYDDLKLKEKEMEERLENYKGSKEERPPRIEEGA